jgi:hypothetical protein
LGDCSDARGCLERAAIRPPVEFFPIMEVFVFWSPKEFVLKKRRVGCMLQKGGLWIVREWSYKPSKKIKCKA